MGVRMNFLWGHKIYASILLCKTPRMGSMFVSPKKYWGEGSGVCALPPPLGSYTYNYGREVRDGGRS